MHAREYRLGSSALQLGTPEEMAAYLEACLEEANGDEEKAIEILRKKGEAKAAV